MKIRTLRFKNLNSLYGEWSIDFTNPAYEANGIFAITGPTGAGKSTILDAICLALYGETPRLGKVTKSVNEIMSRRTGECFSEVTFEGGGGVFRCHWGQHRARKSASGALAEAKHEISDAVTGQVLESKKRDTLLAVEARTGMDFTRFTRSILLAQGSFDSFLRSGSDSRAPILEQITGTEIYSRISIEIHERLRREQNEKDKLASEISGAVLLSPEETRTLEEKLILLEKEEKSKGEDFSRLNAAIQWLELIEGLKIQLMSMERERVEIEEKESLFHGQKNKLERSGKAAELEGVYATLITRRRQLEKDRGDHSRAREEIPVLEKEGETLSERLSESRKDSDRARKKMEKETEVFEALRNYDRQIDNLKKSRNDADNERGRIENRCRDFLRESANLEERMNSLKYQESELEKRVDHDSRDLPPFENMGSISQLIQNIEALRKERKEKEAALSAIADDSQHIHIQIERVKEKKDQTIQLIDKTLGESKTCEEEIEVTLDGRVLSEVRREKEGLLREQVLIKRIYDLEEERSRLEAGKACPLCGSVDHPFVQGSIPVQNETEKQISALDQIIEKAERGERHLAELSLSIQNTRELLVKIEAELSNLKTNEAHCKARRDAFSADLGELSLRIKNQEDELLLLLSPMKISEPPSQLTSFLSSLREKHETLKRNENELSLLQKKSEEYGHSLKSSRTLIDSHKELLEEKKLSLSGIERELNSMIMQRKELGGERNPDLEEEILKREIGNLEKREQSLSLENQALFSKIKERQAFLKEREENLVVGEKELEALNREFQKGLEERHFAGEQDFLACRLSGEAREALLSQGEELKKKRIDWDSRFKEKSDTLKREQVKNITSEQKDVLKARQSEMADILKSLGRELGSIKEQLERDIKVRESLKEKQSALIKQERECRRWDNLHSLIGSADGKKYRNIAQGLTFEIMISHANRQLIKMTDRYLLLRDESNPLELNVIDNYQAGEIRSTKNLSGGEGFLISLSLALGLSQMASQKVRVDSLFLDEGFGTLDEEALDMALETLSGLRQSGKLIGVISHVPALKERIGCQLSLQPLTGGKSLLMGPGVEKKA